MSTTPQDIRNNLMSSDAEFRKLVQEHSRFDLQLEELYRQPYLSSEDLLLEITLKKMKLRLKDLMEQHIARHRNGTNHA